MKRRPSLHPSHPDYNQTATHYVIRVGGEFTVDYYLPRTAEQTLVNAIAFWAHMVADVMRDPKSKDEAFKIVLVKRKVGTPRVNGRLRFYQSEFCEWSATSGLKHFAI